MVETISHLFINTIKSYPKEDLLLYKEAGKYVPISSQEFDDMVRHFSLGLKDLGMERGDKLIILSENSPLWTMADLANLCIGGITVPIYCSLVPDQIKYIIEDSDASIVVCSSPELWEKVLVVKNELTKVRHFISLQAEPAEGVMTLAEVKARGKKKAEEDPELFERLAAAVQPQDIASIIYTSGTTGVPKGVMLRHSNFISNIKAVDSIIEFTRNDTVLSFLPLSHVLERMVTFTYLYKGCSVAYAESLDTLGENLLEIQPHIMVNVPRALEKIYAKVIDNVLASSLLKRKIFFWAVKVGKEYGRRKLAGQPIPGSLIRKRNLAYKLVFSKIIAKTGGRVRFFVSGGAALSKDIAEFFYALGLIILEGYGLTETSPVISVNTFEKMKFGTVGHPIPGVEVKIADDGEILTRGPHVMAGYYKMEAETNSAIQDGWFYTGDIGHFDEEGFLVITDRKKDIIVTAGGKNVAPQLIENNVKISPYIANIVAVGDKRRFISALVVPDFDKLEQFAQNENITYSNHEELCKHERIISLIEEEIEKYTQNLASYEKIKKIILLTRDFHIDKGEMTPSYKVRRSIVEERYKDQINLLYQD